MFLGFGRYELPRNAFRAVSSNDFAASEAARNPVSGAAREEKGPKPHVEAAGVRLCLHHALITLPLRLMFTVWLEVVVTS